MATIRYVTGDLIVEIRNAVLMGTGPHYFAHGANCYATMGAGVAAALAKAFPEVILADKRFGLPLGEARLGKVSVAELSAGTAVFNLYTQLYGGPNFSGEALASAMAELKARGVREVTIPKIGAGIGGGDWTEISRILEDSGVVCRVVCLPGATP